MNDWRFKTLRHVETLRNYLNAVIRELLTRQEQHDQTKFEIPEAEYFEEFTHKLRGITYGSDEYKQCMEAMKPGVEHHQKSYRHHPEYFQEEADATFRSTPIHCMNLIDLIEMLCDWKAAGLRHADGDLMKSIEINQERFGYSDEIKYILINTATWINEQDIFHHAEQS